jgi:C_GCAxxG_C_C family probable redox protein
MRFSEGEMTAEKAGELTAKGYMCSQCVFGRFAQELGMDEELALRLTASFGGGSFFGGTCGAVIGAHMALALRHGWSEEPSHEQIMKLEGLVKEFNTRFAEQNGSILCREILGKSFADPEESAEIFARNLMAGCPAVISSACDILEELLEEE